MSSSHFNNARNILHTYSHAPYVEGQEFIDQASARAGHNVNEFEVRSQQIPHILTIQERDTNYLILENGKKVVGGILGSNYTNIIKFLDKASLREIPNSNGEAYVVIDEEGNVYKNFICPTDAQENSVVPSNGYEIRLFSQNGIQIPRNYGWDFDTFNGILHFSSKFNPKTEDWKFGSPKIEAFIYIGKTTSETINETFNQIIDTKDNIKDLFDSAIAIQPYRFNTSDMTKEGEPYIGNYIGFKKTVPEYYQKLSIKIAGYCFELSSINDNETIITEMRHLPNGDTQIFIDLPWNLEYDKAILYYGTDGGEDGVGNRVPYLESTNVKYTFLASTFIRNDGQKIQVKPVIDCSDQDYIDTSLSGDNGWEVPPRNLNDVVNINVNL